MTTFPIGNLLLKKEKEYKKVITLI